MGDVVTPITKTRDPRSIEVYVCEIPRPRAKALYHRQRSRAFEEGGGLPVVLGGDRQRRRGLRRSRREARPPTWASRSACLWVDAHGDMNTPASSLRAATSTGCPLAALLGGEPEELATLGGFAPKVLPQCTVLLGVRNLDEREERKMSLFCASGVHVFTMKDIDRPGIAAVTNGRWSIVARGTAGIHVSFDIDVCDAPIAPGVGTPVRAASTTARRTW